MNGILNFKRFKLLSIMVGGLLGILSFGQAAYSQNAGIMIEKKLLPDDPVREGNYGGSMAADENILAVGTRNPASCFRTFRLKPSNKGFYSTKITTAVPGKG